MIASGRVHVAGDRWRLPAGEPRQVGMGRRHGRRAAAVAPQGELIGWTDGTDIYLESSTAYKLARQHAEAEGQPLDHLQADGARAAARARKLLASTGREGHLTARHRLGGAQQTVVHLTVSTFDGEAA